MSGTSSKVHLIVAPDYGERLAALSFGEPTWVADTSINGPVISRVRSSSSNSSGKKSANITSFTVAPNQTSEEWLLNILSTLEEHHGQNSQTPPYSVLRVVGTSLSPRVKTELEIFGFARFENSSDGFIAYKHLY